MVPFDDATKARAALGLGPNDSRDVIEAKYKMYMNRYNPKFYMTDTEKERSDEIIAAYTYLIEHEFAVSGSAKANRIDGMLDTSVSKDALKQSSKRLTDDEVREQFEEIFRNYKP